MDHKRIDDMDFTLDHKRRLDKRRHEWWSLRRYWSHPIIVGAEKHIWNQKTGLAKLSKSYEESDRFQIFKHSKRRSRVRGDKIWCEKSKSPRNFHPYNAAVFSSAPSCRNARAPDSLHRRVHQTVVSVSVKKKRCYILLLNLNSKGVWYHEFALEP